MSLREPDFAQLRKKNFTFHLFGKGVVHSKAPVVQNFLFGQLGLAGFRYQPLDSLDVDAFRELIAANTNAASEADLRFNGSAVTMPHKVVMAQHVDIVDDNAKQVGAINTIYVRFDASGRALNIGTNTDTVGIRDSFLYNARDTVEHSRNNNKPALVYGGGGACRSAVYALHAYLGSDTIYVVNRFADEVAQLASLMVDSGFQGKIVHVATPEAAAALEAPELVVLTVPDFEPTTAEEKTARATLEVFLQAPAKGAVLEMCYHPNEITRLYKDFERQGWNVISGVEAMIYQAVAQQVLWTGFAIEEMPVKAVLEHVYAHLRGQHAT